MNIRRTRPYLADRLRYALLAQTFSAGVSKADFESDIEKQLAILRALEVIGEAAKNIPSGVRELSPATPWRRISGMRDKLFTNISASISTRSGLSFKMGFPL